MVQTVSLLVSAEDRACLRALIADRNSAQKHVQRVRIILHSADRLPVLEVARRSGASRPAVWRWQLRYAEQGVDGLLRDKTRKPGRAPLSPETVAKVLALPCSDAPGNATHWTGRAVAKAVGVSLRAVQRIWDAHRLQPHRLRTFKLSRDPAFAEKVEDVVGLYMAPPCHAVVLSIDEKSQIQALDRTQPGLPLKPGKCQTMTHDYKRNGTTTLFAALNVLDGTVLGRCMDKHRHQEFITFLNAVERAVPVGKVIHAILDNYATHKHPKVQRWLANHPRWVFHFTRHQHHGSTPSKASSPLSPDNASGAASSDPSRNWKTPSDVTSRTTIATQDHSSGPRPQIKSCKSSGRSLHHLNESVH
jgi:hypothetical protein